MQVSGPLNAAATKSVLGPWPTRQDYSARSAFYHQLCQGPRRQSYVLKMPNVSIASWQALHAAGIRRPQVRATLQDAADKVHPDPLLNTPRK